MSELGDAALDLARRGYPVFRLAVRSKVPLLSAKSGGRGLHDATPDARIVARWWQANPRANIGLVTGARSGLVVIDLDGDQGAESFLQLQRQHGRCPDTLWARTGSGGWHCYFQHPGGAMPNTAGKLGPGIDTRGDGGYVVAPPSITTGSYSWHTELEPAPLPVWLLDLLRPPPPPTRPRLRVVGDGDRYAESALLAECDTVAGTAAGSRNHQLNASAFSLGTLVGAGRLQESTAWSALLEAALACGLSEAEARRTIQSGLTAGQRSPREISA